MCYEQRTHLLDIDHHEAVDLWIFLLIEAAICERHLGPCSLNEARTVSLRQWSFRLLLKSRWGLIDFPQDVGNGKVNSQVHTRVDLAEWIAPRWQFFWYIDIRIRDSWRIVFWWPERPKMQLLRGPVVQWLEGILAKLPRRFKPKDQASAAAAFTLNHNMTVLIGPSHERCIQRHIPYIYEKSTGPSNTSRSFVAMAELYSRKSQGRCC